MVEPLNDLLHKILVNGHSMNVCSMDSLSPQYRHLSSGFIPNLNSSLFVTIIHLGVAGKILQSHGHSGGQTSWIRSKIEFSSYVNKALLNLVFGSFQRSLRANSYFTVSYIYLSNIFIKTWEKRPLCHVRM